MTTKVEPVPVKSYTINGVEYPVHSAALAFPLLDGPELAVFVNDIAKKGIQEPVAIWRGQLLDGRNRVAAAQTANVRIPLRQLDDDVDPYSFVLSANGCRRHQTQSQLAMACARLHEEWKEYRHRESLRQAAAEAERAPSDIDPRSAMGAAGAAGADRAPAATGNSSPSAPMDPASAPPHTNSVPGPPPATSQVHPVRRPSPSAAPGNLRNVAAHAGVSSTLASLAARIRKSAPELEAPISAGTITINDAKELLHLPSEERRQAVEAVQRGEARKASHAVRRPTDGTANTVRSTGPSASPDASSQLAAVAPDEQPNSVPAEIVLPKAVLAGIRDELGDIDFAFCPSAEEQRNLRARTCPGDGAAVAGPWSGTVYLRPRVGQVEEFADRLLAGLDAGRVSRAALFAPTDLTAIWLHRVLAHDRLSVVVLEDGRPSLQPRRVADERPAYGGMGLFLFGTGMPARAFFETIGSWGHVLAPWSQVRPTAFTARPKQGWGSLQAVLTSAQNRMRRS